LIAELGKLHHGRERVQPSSREIREFYDRAGAHLKFPLLSLSPREFATVAAGFEDAIRGNRYTCYACAIMSDHVHVLIRKHRDIAEEMIDNRQKSSWKSLIAAGARTTDHPTWGGPGWKVFLDTPEDIRRTIKYIGNDPMPFRLPRQHWSFVAPYDNWPLQHQKR